LKHEEIMLISPNGTVPSTRSSDRYFSGVVIAEQIVAAPSPARLKAARVTFLPGARTAWHHHPYGQTLFVTSGTGLVQVYGEPARLIKPGDTVWIGPGEKHWHGATATTAMTHIAMHEHQDGVYATWQEHVADEDYAAANASSMNAET